jgi:hypothetical protein
MPKKFYIYNKIFSWAVGNFFQYLCELVRRHQMRVSNYFVNSFYSVQDMQSLLLLKLLCLQKLENFLRRTKVERCFPNNHFLQNCNYAIRAGKRHLQFSYPSAFSLSRNLESTFKNTVRHQRNRNFFTVNKRSV